MNITANAASLDWRSNKHGVWKALVKDMAPNSSVAFSAGLTGTVAGRQVTVESPSMPTGFMTYTTDITDGVVGSMLYGAGSVSDSLEVVGGEKTVRMGSYTFTGNETWMEYPYISNAWSSKTIITDSKSHSVAIVPNVILPGYDIVGVINASSAGDKLCSLNSTYNAANTLAIRDTSCTTAEELAAKLAGKTIYYELAEPMTSTETAQSLALQTGVNNLALNERGSSFTLDYTGTDFTLQLDSAHKYAFSDNGVKSVLTGSSEQAVTGGQDMLVDVTRMFNGDTTAINAVTSWADMAAVMPEYLSNVAYNEGEVIGRSGGVTTAKWNQLEQPLTATYWRSYKIVGATEGVVSFNTTNNTVTLTTNDVSTQVACIYTAGSGNYITLQQERVYVFRHEVKGPQGYAFAFNLPIGGMAFISRATMEATDTWQVNAKLYRTPKDAVRANFLLYTYQDATHAGMSATFQIRNVQLFDLTEIYGAGYEPSTVEEFEADCTKWGKDLSQYQPYDAGTPMGGSATFSGLHGVGTTKDTQDVVTGEKIVRMASVDMGTLAYSSYQAPDAAHPYGFCSINNINKAFGYNNFISTHYLYNGVSYDGDKTFFGSAVNRYIYLIDSSLIGKSASEVASAMAGRQLAYELAEPTTSSETPQPLTTIKGLNNAHEENMSITGTPLTMGYTGTDQTLYADTASKYLARIDGADFVLENVSSIDVRGGRDRVIDLTYMFGVGNEPVTAADFYKLFPTWMGYAIPYNKGSLLNFKGTGLKSVGFNLLDTGNRTLGQPQNTVGSNTTVRGVFDETKYYVGFAANNYYSPAQVLSHTISSSAVSVTNRDGGYGVAFPIRVIPGRTYYIENYISHDTRFAFYTYNGKWIGGYESRAIEAPATAYWALIVLTTPGNQSITWTNPCVHLQWSGGRNGDYEPYWDYTRPLPTLTYFPSGMNGRGGVYDETTSRQAVTRLTEIDMEDLEWTESNGSWTATVSGMKADTAAIVAENGLKPVVSGTSVTVPSDASPVGKLVYELASQSVVTFPEEVNTTAQVSDYGTESVVPVNGYELVTAPFLGIVKYQDNYARTITKLPENYQSQDSMASLQLVLGQLLNVTLTSRFNADEQAYGYTVTGDGVPGLIAAALTALAPVTGLTFRGGTYMPTDGMVALPDPTIQGITAIPASTSSYTLGEGVYSHAPNSVPTYTLPAVEDATVVHKARLTVKMSASVLTANFRNSAGVAIGYEPPAGDVRAGTLVEYVCTYEPLAGGWAVSARVVMQTA